MLKKRFYAITREKATAEAIDNLIASDAAGSPLHHAIQELGRDPVADAVDEIKERREAMREIRRSLMALHQVLLGIATPSPVQQVAADGGNKGDDVACAVESLPAAAGLPPAFGGGGKGGAGGLNDYERETRNQAYIAIVIALVIVTTLIISYLKVEILLETETD